MSQLLSNFTQEFEPTETFIDPVNKIRVSTPENLIDTDFEYGLQTTKWETLELSNNVPSYFVSDSDLPLSNVESVNSVVDSDIILVRTTEPHGLVAGTPIDVRGLTSRTAEGKYLIKSVPSDEEFTYAAVSIQSSTGDVGSIYTTITPGQFYSGSQIPFDPAIGITSDGGAQSILTVQTPATHGFPAGSNFYLVNSIGTKKVTIPEEIDTQDDAPDGRPYVDIAQTINVSLTPDLTRTETKEMRSTYYLKFNASAVDVATDRITWTNHGFRDNDVLLYVPPSGDTQIGGMQRFQIYYVRNPQTNDFQLSRSFNGTVVNFTDTGTYNFGRAGLHLVYEIYHFYKYYYDYRNRLYTTRHMTGSGSGWDLDSNSYGKGAKRPTNMMLFTPTNYTPTTNAIYWYFSQGRNGNMVMPESSTTPSLYNWMEDYTRYRNYFVAQTGYYNFNGNYFDYYDYNSYYYSSYSYYPYYGNFFLMFLDPDEESDTFYSEDSDLINGAPLTVTVNSGNGIYVSNSNTDINNNNANLLYGSGNHYVERVSKDRFRIKFDNRTDRTRLAQATGNYTFGVEKSNPLKNTLYFANHGFASDETVRLLAEGNGDLPATSTAKLVPNSDPSSGNLGSAFAVINSYIDNYVTGLGASHEDLVLNGSGANTALFSNSGVASGQSSLVYRMDNYPDPYLYSIYLYGQALNVSNGFRNNAQSPSVVKDAGEGTVMANRGFSYLGTAYQQNGTVPHYTTVYSVASPTNRDVIDFRLHTRTYASSMSTWSSTNRSYTIAGDSGWRASFGARWGTAPSAIGYVEYHGVIWNNSWVPGYSHPLYEVYTPGNDQPMYARPYSYSSNWWGKPIFFRTIIRLAGGASYNSTDATTFGDSLVNYFATNFVPPQFVQGEYVKTVSVTKDRLGFKNTAGSNFILEGQGDAILSVVQEGLIGTNDGAYTVSNVPASNQFEIQLPFQSPTSTIAVDVSTVTADNLVQTAVPHFFSPGTQIVYRLGLGSSGIPELTNGTSYYLYIQDDEYVGFASTYDNAVNGDLIEITAGTSGNDSLEFAVVNGRVAGVGTIDVTSGSKVVTGTGSLFKRYFKVGDNIGIKDNNTAPGKIELYRIAAIADDTTLQLEAPAVTTSIGTKYFLTTKLYARPDGYSVHRPFDGGVEIAAGTAPYSQITRQTRKYFRYQSGKGIQTSLAINFNPPVQYETLVGTTRSRLVPVEDAYTVTIEGAARDFSVTNQGTTGYLIDGVASGSVTLIRGETYTFNLNAEGHPFFIQTTTGSGYDAANVYTDGVVGSGTDVGQVIFTVPTDAPATLYYQCQLHAAMNGVINIINDPGTTPDVLANGSNDSITLYRGELYRFQLDTEGHLISVSTASTWDSFNDYNEGVLGDGLATGEMTFLVPLNAPSTLYLVTENNTANPITLNVTQPVYESVPVARGTTRYPHRLLKDASIRVSGATESIYNGDFTVSAVIDEFTFDVDLPAEASVSVPGGIIQYNMNGYTGAYTRAGMFDGQNGFFFEFDGQDLYCVRRSSTQQLSGKVSVFNNSNLVRGVNTNFYGQLEVGDMIVIRGGSYKVTEITSRTDLVIQPQYKGRSADNVIVTKTIDTKVARPNWSVDPCDGTGNSGYLLDLNKIQMAYMDYSWYGAGKIRFGFKDTNGHVKYVHEFIHNNRLDEAYMRSGNLPAKYEIENGPSPDYAPTLFHWGTSVIMDGTFDEDDAYLFTAASKSLSFTNGQSLTATTNQNSQLFYVYNRATRNYDWYVRFSFPTADSSKFSTGTKLYTSNNQLNGQEVAYTQFSGSNILVHIYIQSGFYTPAVYPVVTSGTAVSIGQPPVQTGNGVNLGTDVIPLLTIRLAPSVDSGLSGELGAREVINRMQLKLAEVGLILTHDCEVSMILNGDLSNVAWENVKAPSLSQLLKHDSGDKIVGGVEIFSFRASGGSTDNTGKRLSATSNFPLGTIIDMGNSILGGNGTFPNGPDILTVAVKVVDTQGLSAVSPFVASSRITWAESQA
jgi:hypothetical protein